MAGVSSRKCSKGVEPPASVIELVVVEVVVEAAAGELHWAAWWVVLVVTAAMEPAPKAETKENAARTKRTIYFGIFSKFIVPDFVCVSWLLTAMREKTTFM